MEALSIVIARRATTVEIRLCGRVVGLSSFLKAPDMFEAATSHFVQSVCGLVDIVIIIIIIGSRYGSCISNDNKYLSATYDW